MSATELESARKTRISCLLKTEECQNYIHVKRNDRAKDELQV